MSNYFKMSIQLCNTWCVIEDTNFLNFMRDNDERMLLLRHALKLEGISITSVSCLDRKRLEPRFDLHSSPK